MSKYVRTKNEIYEVEEENNRYYKCCYGDGHITLVAKFDNDVNGVSKALKSADTIEKLCDEVVIKTTNTSTNKTWYSNYPMELYKDEKRSMVNNSLDYIKIDYVKFGIWNDDKGLIYVAKLNDKGELKLI